MHNLIDWELTLKILQGISYITSMLGVIGLFVAIRSYRDGKKIQSDAEKNKKIQTSIDILKTFSTSIIPEMSGQDQKFKEEFSKVQKNVIEQLNNEAQKEGLPTNIDENSLTKDIINKILLQTKLNLKVSRTFNKLEHITIYMNYEMIEEEIVYNAIHKVFLEYVEQHSDLLKQMTSDQVPFANIYQLTKKWQKKNKIQTIDKRRKQLDNEIRNLESNL